MSDYKITLTFDAGQPKAAMQGLEQVLEQLRGSGKGVEATFEGVSKSAKAKQRELIKLTREYERVRGQIDPAARASQALERQHRTLAAAVKAGITTQAEYNRLMSEARRSTTEQATAMQGLAGMVRAAVGSYAALKTVDLARDAINTARAYDAEAKALKTATGGRAEAARETQFLEEVSDRYGLRLRGLGGEYAKLIASAKNLKREDVRTLFEGTATAGAALALTGEQVNGIITAYGQIAGKSRVQTEELNQIAERLPGTFAAVAEAMGLSEQELRDQIEKGEVLASDLLPRLGRALKDTFSEEALANAGDLTARINRLENAIDKAKIAFGAGASDGLSSAIGEATTQGKQLEPVARALGVSLGAIAGLATKAFNAESQKWGVILDLIMSGPGNPSRMAAAAEAGKAIGDLDRVMGQLMTREVDLAAATDGWTQALERYKVSGAGSAEQTNKIRMAAGFLVGEYQRAGKEVPAALSAWVESLHQVEEATDNAAGNGGGGGGATGLDEATKKLHERVVKQTAVQAQLAAALRVSSAEYQTYVTAQKLGLEIADGLSSAERSLTEQYLEQEKAVKELLALEEKRDAAILARVEKLQEESRKTAALAAYMASYADAVMAVVGSMGHLERDGSISDYKPVDPDRIKATLDELKKGKQAAADVEQAWAAANERIASNMGAVFGDAFADVVRTGEFSFESLMGSVLDMWIDLLADMVAEWAAKQWTMNVTQSTTGSATGTATQASSFFSGGASSLTYAAVGIAAVYMARETWQNARYKALADSMHDVTRALDRTSDLLGRNLDSGQMVWARGDGKGFSAGRQGPVFDNYEDALAALALMTLQATGQQQAAGIGTDMGFSERQLEILGQIDETLIRMGDAGLQWVERGLEVANTLDAMSTTPVQASLREIESQFYNLTTAAREYGFAQADVIEWRYRELAALQDSIRARYEQYLPGYDPIKEEFDAIRRDAAELNAAYAEERKKLQEEIEAVLRSIERLSSGIAGGAAGGGAASAFQQVDEYMRQLMEIMSGGTGGLLVLDQGPLLSDLLQELNRLGDIAAGGGLAPDQVRRLEEQRALLALLMEQLEAMGADIDMGEIDEAERRARQRGRSGRSGPSRDEQIAAFNDELDRLTRSLLPDGVRELAELDEWLQQWTARANELQIPLERVNELYEQQRQRLEEQAAAQEAADRQQRKDDLYGSLVQLGANPYDEIFKLHATMREALLDLRRSAEELGYSAEDVARWTAEIADHQMQNLLERMAQYLNDQALNTELLELKWSLERGQIALQIHLLEQQANLLGITAEEIERLWELFGRLPTAPPPGFGGSPGVSTGGGSVGGSGGGVSAADLRDQLADFMRRWTEQGLSSFERDLSRINAEFTEAIAKFRTIPGAVAQLTALQQDAVRGIFDAALDRYRDLEVDPLQRELNELNETFAELIRLAPEYGYSLAEIREAQEAALEGFWERALSPIRDFLDSFNLSNLSPLTPEQRLDAAQDRFDSLVAQALSGDLSALSQIPAAAQQLLAEGAGMFGTAGSLYQDLWAMVQATLAQVLGLDPNAPAGPVPGGGPGLGTRPGGVDLPGLPFPGGIGPRDLAPLSSPAVHVSFDLSRVERGQDEVVSEVRRMRESISMLAADQSRYAAAVDRLARAAN